MISIDDKKITEAITAVLKEEFPFYKKPFIVIDTLTVDLEADEADPSSYYLTVDLRYGDDEEAEHQKSLELSIKSNWSKERIAGYFLGAIENIERTENEEE